MKKLITMKISYIKFLFIITIFICAGRGFSQERLTLEESVKLGLQNSKDLKISNSKIVSSDAGIDIVNSQFLPQLKFQASYSRLSSVPDFDVLLPFLSKPITISQTILNNYNFRLSLQQPLFTGFRLIAQRNSSKLVKQSTESDFQKDKNEAAMNIQVAFWNYYKTMEIMSVIEDNLKVTRRHIDDTKNFYNNGLATQNDVLKLEVQESNTELMEVDAKNNIELARSSFNKTLGLPLDENTQINAVEIQRTEFPGNYTALVKEAIDNRNELKSLDFRIEASRENIRASRSSYFPQIFLNANYYFNRPNQRYQPPEDKFHSSWDVGVNLSWDIWTWGNVSAQVTQSEQNLYQAQTQKEQLKENIELEVNQNYLAVKYALNKLDVLEKTIDQAEENLRETSDKYNNQLATSTDLVDAENSLLTAQTNYKTALVDYQISRIKLLKAIGRKLY